LFRRVVLARGCVGIDRAEKSDNGCYRNLCGMPDQPWLNKGVSSPKKSFERLRKKWAHEHLLPAPS
jgi:hypothetical protein